MNKEPLTDAGYKYNGLIPFNIFQETLKKLFKDDVKSITIKPNIGPSKNGCEHMKERISKTYVLHNAEEIYSDLFQELYEECKQYFTKYKFPINEMKEKKDVQKIKEKELQKLHLIQLKAPSSSHTY